ncbi:hypothetical protein [Leptospira alexanderi]|uniref:hypothetical protein n=1 Tax=Leptospira alexanderi TaxID=100053 RepID=UPI002014BBEE|nr:hypothetical protein [Leptospira alexanderi]
MGDRIIRISQIRRIEYFFLALLTLYGCLQFPQVSTPQIGNESNLDGLSQDEVCIEYISETMNGRTLEATLKLSEKAYFDLFYKIKNEIQNHFNENSEIRNCYIGFKARAKILISLEINLNADCTRKQSVDEFNGCEIWGFLTGLTLGIVPFWGRSTSEIRFEIVDAENRKRKYQYQPSVYTITHILLFPFAWINLIRSMPEAPFRQSVELFFLDSGLKKNSLPR